MIFKGCRGTSGKLQSPCPIAAYVCFYGANKYCGFILALASVNSHASTSISLPSSQFGITPVRILVLVCIRSSTCVCVRACPLFSAVDPSSLFALLSPSCLPPLRLAGSSIPFTFLILTHTVHAKPVLVKLSKHPQTRGKVESQWLKVVQENIRHMCSIGPGLYIERHELAKRFNHSS